MEPKCHNEGNAPPAYNNDQSHQQQYNKQQQWSMAIHSSNTGQQENRQQGYPHQAAYIQTPGSYSQGVVVTQPAHMTHQPGQNAVMQAPESHAGLAWFSCLLCCWPLGLVAIIKSNEVNSAYYRGDVAGAQLASQSAKKFSMLSIGFGIISWIAAVILIVVNVTAAAGRRTTVTYG